MSQTSKTVLLAVIVAIVAFWGGSVYGKHSVASTKTTATAGQYGQFAGRGAGMRGAGGAAAGSFVGGTVLSTASNSITVQNQAGGSKIILVSPATMVSKSTAGSLSDITVGSSILATGTTNSDGSITAETVQIRPASADEASAQASPAPQQ